MTLLTSEELSARLSSSSDSSLPEGIVAYVRVLPNKEFFSKATGPIHLYGPAWTAEQLGHPDTIVASSEHQALKLLNRLYRPPLSGVTKILSLEDASLQNSPLLPRHTKHETLQPSKESLGLSSQEWAALSYEEKYTRQILHNGWTFAAFPESHFINTRDPHLINEAISKLGSLPIISPPPALQRDDHTLSFYLHKNPQPVTGLPIIGKSKAWKNRRQKLAASKSKRAFDAGLIPTWAFQQSNETLSHLNNKRLLVPPCRSVHVPYYSRPSYSHSRCVNEITSSCIRSLHDLLSALYTTTGRNISANWKSDRPIIYTIRRIPELRSILLEAFAPFAPYLPCNPLALKTDNHPLLQADYQVKSITRKTMRVLFMVLRDLGVPPTMEALGDTTPPHEIEPMINYRSSRPPHLQFPDTPEFSIKSEDSSSTDAPQ